MAKRKKMSKCPEPFNTLIDIAAGATMHAIADKMEKKHQYYKRGAPNPYRASAYGFTTGRLNSTEDIIRLGGLMGAMGAFDDDCAPPAHHFRYADSSWEFDEVSNNNPKSNDNRYAWRLNCEDGSSYGICPENYKTRNEYNKALQAAKLDSNDNCIDDFNISVAGEDHVVNFTSPQEDLKPTSELNYCKVSILKSGDNLYFVYEDEDIAIGNMVIVSIDGAEEKGIVLSVEHHTPITAPCNPENTQRIIRVEK